MNSFIPYLKLRDKIDLESQKLHNLHEEHLMCKAGCSACCMNFGILPVEYHYIKSQLVTINFREIKPKDSESEDCMFLKNHQCTIYEHRPIICRTHGYPLLYMGEDEETMELSACELNFRDFEFENFDSDNTMHMDLFNNKLYIINQAFMKENPHLNYNNKSLLPLNSLGNDL